MLLSEGPPSPAGRISAGRRRSGRSSWRRGGSRAEGTGRSGTLWSGGGSPQVRRSGRPPLPGRRALLRSRGHLAPGAAFLFAFHNQQRAHRSRPLNPISPDGRAPSVACTQALRDSSVTALRWPPSRSRWSSAVAEAARAEAPLVGMRRRSSSGGGGGISAKGTTKPPSGGRRQQAQPSFGAQGALPLPRRPGIIVSRPAESQAATRWPNLRPSAPEDSVLGRAF